MTSTVLEPINMDYAARLQRLQASLASRKLDCLLITHLPNVHYLCGFTGSAAVLMVTTHGCILFTDGRYRAQAAQEAKGTRVVIARKPPLVAAGGWVGEARGGSLRSARLGPLSVGIEPESLTAGARDRLATLLKGKARLRSAPPLVEHARMVKDV